MQKSKIEQDGAAHVHLQNRPGCRNKSRYACRGVVVGGERGEGVGGGPWWVWKEGVQCSASVVVSRRE